MKALKNLAAGQEILTKGNKNNQAIKLSASMRTFRSDFDKLSEPGGLVRKTTYYQSITSIVTNR